MAYWAMRTDKTHPHLFMEELQKGYLRQGWGYEENQDLRQVLEAKQKGTLDPDQAVTLRNLPMLGHEASAMQEGDIVLLPNLPDPGTFSLCKLTGPYHFAIYRQGDIADYGHIRPAELIEACQAIPYSNEHVGEGLRRTLTNRGRLWRLDHLREELELIRDKASQGTKFDNRNGTEVQFAQLLGEVRDVRLSLQQEAQRRVREHITQERIGRAARAANLEGLLVRVLRTSFPAPATVEWTGGPNEQGADILIRLPTPFEDDEMVIVVQVKDHVGLTSFEGVDQLRRAIEYYGGSDKVVQAVLASAAEGFTPKAVAQAKALEDETKVRVRLIDGKRLQQIIADGLLSLAAFADI